jgi:hypothetical protein
MIYDNDHDYLILQRASEAEPRTERSCVFFGLFLFLFTLFPFLFLHNVGGVPGMESHSNTLNVLLTFNPCYQAPC